MQYKSIRGFSDVLPDEAAHWQRIEAASRKIFGIFGYREIRTPIIEESGLFIKSVGEETDIVKKEMFAFKDRGDRDIALRPEGTAPIIRAYLEHNLDKTEPFQKLYYIGPMFRAERPQAGRLRQFSQIGIEAIGTSESATDAEVIRLLVKLVDSIGIKGCELKINNLGCREDKKRLSAQLKEALSEKSVSGALCDDCKARVGTNPLRVLDCKVESCKKIVREKFKNSKFLCADCDKHFDSVLKFLDLLEIKYTLDPYIVRGLDYYTRTVFELTCSSLGAQNAIGAGGRYDNLIKDMGGADLGACGFAIGVERAILAMAGELPREAASGPDVFIAALGSEAYLRAFKIADELRCAGVSCEIEHAAKSLKSQMRSADKLGARFALIIGDDEIKKSAAVLRDMRTKEQTEINFNGIVGKIKEKAAGDA